MPVAVDLAPLLALALVSFLILILASYKATLGAVVDWLIGHIPRIGFSVAGQGVKDVFGFIRAPLEAFQNLVYHTLGVLLEANHTIWTKFVQWNAYAWQEVSGAVADLAENTEQALHYLRRSVIARMIALALNPVAASVLALSAAVGLARHEVAKLSHITRNVTVQNIDRTRTYVTKVVQGATVGAVATVAGAVPRLWHGIDHAEGTAERALREARRLAGRLSVSAVAGLLVAALATIGATWLRCSNVKKAGERVCGMDTDLLNALIADTLLIVGTLDLVTAAEDMQEILEPLSSSVLHFWRAD